MLAVMRLSSQGARVLGSLVEKELTTPQQYPLTITSLAAACNQATNRDPVVDYDEGTLLSTLDELKAQRLVRFVLPSHGRSVVRYRHVVDETLALEPRQRALLAVLLLRGPQTLGELHTRTDRMADFDGIDDVGHELAAMGVRDEPLVLSLGRRPGQKEDRWGCALVASAPGDPVGDAGSGVSLSGSEAEREAERTEPAKTVPSSVDAPDTIRAELATLRSEVSELRSELDALRASLGG
jgi:uncharacterized protein